MSISEVSLDQAYFSAWSIVTVGVENLDVALSLWVDEFGMNVLSSKDGEDSELAKLWGVEPEDIARQALVQTNNQKTGMLHFVEFSKPNEAVRKNAKPYDLTPKNLDIYTEDLVAKLAELQQKGYKFRSNEASLITAPDGTQFREVHMFGHDDINIVLLEVVGKKKPFSNKGIAAVGPLVFIVPDVSAESEFFESLFLVDKLNDNTFDDPDLIKAIGLPGGTVLNIHILGRIGIDLGQLEIIQYKGVEGNNLYPRAKPKSLGVLHISYIIPDNCLLLERLSRVGTTVSKHGVLETLYGRCEVISFNSPAGLRIEVYSERC